MVSAVNADRTRKLIRLQAATVQQTCPHRLTKASGSESTSLTSDTRAVKLLRLDSGGAEASLKQIPRLRS